MEINSIGNVLVSVFEVEAAAGLGLLAIVIATLVRAFLAEHHQTRVHPHDRSHL